MSDIRRLRKVGLEPIGSHVFGSSRRCQVIKVYPDPTGFRLSMIGQTSWMWRMQGKEKAFLLSFMWITVRGKIRSSTSAWRNLAHRHQREPPDTITIKSCSRSGCCLSSTMDRFRRRYPSYGCSSEYITPCN